MTRSATCAQSSIRSPPRRNRATLPLALASVSCRASSFFYVKTKELFRPYSPLKEAAPSRSEQLEGSFAASPEGEPWNERIRPVHIGRIDAEHELVA